MAKKLTKQDYERIGRKVGLMKNEIDNYTKFMKKRFPNEFDKEYATEWAERFNTVNPRIFMDKTSLRIYNQILKNKLGK